MKDRDTHRVDLLGSSVSGRAIRRLRSLQAEEPLLEAQRHQDASLYEEVLVGRYVPVEQGARNAVRLEVRSQRSLVVDAAVADFTAADLLRELREVLSGRALRDRGSDGALPDSEVRDLVVLAAAEALLLQERLRVDEFLHSRHKHAWNFRYCR
jgi:hypothetical protein